MTDSGASEEPKPSDSTPPKKVGPVGIAIMGLYLAVLGLVIFYLLVQLFAGTPIDPANDGNQIRDSKYYQIIWIWWAPKLSADGWILLIVILSGALGSFVHTATSYADYVGNRKLTLNWVWWLLMRPPIGIALALIFYLLIRGGLLSGVNAATTDTINPYGFAGIAALVGMFSKQATDKLRELFDNLFRTAEKTERADPLADGRTDGTKGPATPANPVPAIAGTAPAQLAVGAARRTVTVTGTGFVSTSTVRIGGAARSTSVVSETELTFELEDDDLRQAGTLQFVVVNPAPGGGESPPQALPVA